MRRLLPFILAAVVLALFAIPWLVYYRGQAKSYTLTVSTGQPGGVYHPLGQAMADAVHRDHPRLKFKLLESAGSVMSMERLESGAAELALLQNGTPGTDKVRVIAPLYQEVLHILVRADSPAKTLRDLHGKNLAIGPEQSGTRQVVRRLFSHYGFDAGEFHPSFNSTTTACQNLIDGELDAVFAVIGVHSQAIHKAMATGALRLIGLGEAGTVGGEVEGLRLHHPNITPYVIPTNTYPSTSDALAGRPFQAVQTITVPSLLVCRSDLPESVVYDITASIFNNRAPLVRTHPAAAQIHEPADPTSLSYPLHPGADAYYHRHDPGFLVTYAEVIALVLSLAITLWGTVIAIHKWLGLKKKDRIDEYYTQIDEILTYLQNNKNLPGEELISLDSQLSALRHKAVQQLVAEDLQANESFRIFQTLLAHSQSDVRTRIQAISNT